MKVPSGVYSAVQIPGDSVHNTRFNVDGANRTDPTLTLFGIGTGGLLNLKFNAALLHHAWQ
ncbi:MAG: hypothetical protein RL696_333 [Actinomycetota bacterium]